MRALSRLAGACCSCGGGVEVETLEDGADDKLTAKAQKITIKLPWEITTIYSEVLKQSGHQSDDEEDEDEDKKPLTRKSLRVVSSSIKGGETSASAPASRAKLTSIDDALVA